MRSSWQELVRLAESRAADLAPWPHYFRLRAAELERALAGAGVRTSLGRVVEVGCGIGFLAGLLSTLAEETLALDLPQADPETHSLGMARARALCRRLDLPVTLLAGSATQLPLASRSVDLLFSAYVLEHVGDRARACREIARVLAPGGQALLLLPGAVERLWAPLWYYPHTLREILQSALAKRGPTVSGESSAAATAADLTASLGTSQSQAESAGRWSQHPRRLLHYWARFRHHYPHFPALPPHGVYPDSRTEFRASREAAWRALFQNAGLQVLEHRASSVIPVALLDEFSPGLRERIDCRLDPWVRRFGDRGWLKALACGGVWRVGVASNAAELSSRVLALPGAPEECVAAGSRSAFAENEAGGASPWA